MNNAIVPQLAVLTYLISVAVFPVQGSSQCGQSTQGRVIGGTKVAPGVYPWMAVLFQRTEPPLFQCGATLISQKYAITAEHCIIRDPSVLVMVLGTTNVVDYDPDAVQVGIREFITYPVDENDIALIKLETDVQFGPYVQPICLPPTNYDFSGVEAVVIGFGQTSFSSKTSDVLLQGVIHVTTTEHCDEVMPGNQDPPISDDIICAGENDDQTSSCYGDSGGPLMYFNERLSVWELIGIVSTGKQCDTSKGYDIFTNVSRKMDWIMKNTN